MRTCCALFVLVLLVGCGASPSGGSTTPAPTSRVLVALTHAELGGEDDSEDPPRSTVTLVVTDPDGNATNTQLAEVIGLCRPLEPQVGILASQHCWFSGSGVRIHVRQEGDALVITREDLTERSIPSALNAPEVQRFALAPGTEARAADPNQ